MRAMILLGSAWLALGTTGAPAQQSTQPSFCGRLAPNLDMQPARIDPKSGAKAVWQMNMLGGLGTALFGGSAFASFAVEPAGTSSAEDYAALRDACQQTPKGILCRISRPMRLTIQTRKGQVAEEAAPGERAEVEMAKGKIICRDL